MSLQETGSDRRKYSPIWRPLESIRRVRRALTKVSISYYLDLLGFELDFEGPAGDPFYAGVSRDGTADVVDVS
jgi:hypothetical protein